MRSALALVFLAGCSVAAGFPGAGPAAPAASTPAAGPVAAADPAPAAGPAPAAAAAPDDACQEAMEQVRPEERATCDAAHDHCLPPETWFMPMTWKEDTYGTARTGEWVAPGGGEWRPSVVSKGHRSSFLGYRTVPASDDNVAVGAIAVVFSATGCPPQNQAWATTNDWIIGHVAEVDAGGRRFRFEGAKKWLSTAAARVVVETRDHRNDPRP